MTNGQAAYERFMNALYGASWEMLNAKTQAAWEKAAGTDHDRLIEMLTREDRSAEYNVREMGNYVTVCDLVGFHLMRKEDFNDQWTSARNDDLP